MTPAAVLLRSPLKHFPLPTFFNQAFQYAIRLPWNKTLLVLARALLMWRIESCWLGETDKNWICGTNWKTPGR
jgi:hypothetical protein